jgi:hypothetical protein
MAANPSTKSIVAMIYKPGLIVNTTSVKCHLLEGVTRQKSDGFPASKETRIEIEDDETF